MRRLLVISNGIGEDSVGAEIVKRLPQGTPVDAYPMLGDGAFYAPVCPVVGPRARVVSEGSRVGAGSILADIRGGMLGTIPPTLKFLREARRRYDRFLVVGDFIGVGACWAAGIRDIVYLDVYKTGYGRLYAGAERWVIAKTCRTVFCRSPNLSEPLRAMGVDARAAGNVMMDTVASGDYAANRTRPMAVALLPGSRRTTVANFALQVEALVQLPETLRPDVFVAVAEGIAPDELAAAAGLTHEPPATNGTADLGRLAGHGLTINLARGALAEVLAASDLVLSQAGTATIQALGLGKPVLTFVRDTDRRKRFEEENRLFGDGREIVTADADVLATRMAALLADPAELARRGQIGAGRIGPPGVIGEIIAALEL